MVRNQSGKLRMYDDPAQEVPACGSSLSCLGQVLGVYGVAAYLTLDNLTAIRLERGPDHASAAGLAVGVTSARGQSARPSARSAFGNLSGNLPGRNPNVTASTTRAPLRSKPPALTISSTTSSIRSWP